MAPSDALEERREWFRQAVLGHQRSLTLYALHLLGDLGKAQEAVQDTFLKLWAAKRQSIEDHMASWLFLVCRNLALDMMRKEKKMQRYQTNQRDTAPAMGGTSHGELISLLAMMQELPPLQREVITLKFQQDLSYKEISRITGISESNVGMQLHLGLCALRTRLAKDEDRATQAGALLGRKS